MAEVREGQKSKQRGVREQVPRRPAARARGGEEDEKQSPAQEVPRGDQGAVDPRRQRARATPKSKPKSVRKTPFVFFSARFLIAPPEGRRSAPGASLGTRLAKAVATSADAGERAEPRGREAVREARDAARHRERDQDGADGDGDGRLDREGRRRLRLRVRAAFSSSFVGGLSDESKPPPGESWKSHPDDSSPSSAESHVSLPPPPPSRAPSPSPSLSRPLSWRRLSRPAAAPPRARRRAGNTRARRRCPRRFPRRRRPGTRRVCSPPRRS